MANPCTIRPYQSSDLSAISTISALGNLEDALTKYMRHSRQSKYTSYRLSCVRFLKYLVRNPGTVGFVAESSTTGEILGWAIWSRHGTSEKAKEWQRPNSGLLNRIERTLLRTEQKYFEWIPNTDPTADHAHFKHLMPILQEEWPSEIFTEFWELDGLYVHPDHYRKGIGKMLAVWGVEKGKEEGVPVLIHSSPAGRKLYESVGFEVVSRMFAFDAWIPEFKGMGPDGEGCWAMCWQPPGTDYLQRARAKVQKSEMDEKAMTGTPASSIRMT